MPIVVFDTKDSIPSDFEGEVKPTDDGKFQVNLSLTSKVTEFRENNVTVSAERDALAEEVSKYKEVIGDDLEEFTTSLTTLKDTRQQVEDGKLTKKTDIEQEVSKRTTKMRDEYEAKLRESATRESNLKANVAELQTQSNRSSIAAQVQAVINSEDAGIHASAAADITARAVGRFTVTEDGEVLAKNGDSIIYGADGTTPESVSEWMQGLKETSPHFFKESTGGGAKGGDKFGGLSKEEYSNLSARKRLEMHNAGQL